MSSSAAVEARQSVEKASIHHAPCAGVAAQPVTVVQPVEAHSAATARSMDEAPVPYIDAGVIHFAATFHFEEQQIAGLQRVGWRPVHLQRAQFARGARQRDAGGFAVDVLDQAAAIEAGGGRTAAVAVGRADQVQGPGLNIGSPPGLRAGDAGMLANRCGCAGAARQQAHQQRDQET